MGRSGHCTNASSHQLHLVTACVSLLCLLLGYIGIPPSVDHQNPPFPEHVNDRIIPTKNQQNVAEQAALHRQSSAHKTFQTIIHNLQHRDRCEGSRRSLLFSSTNTSSSSEVTSNEIALQVHHLSVALQVAVSTRRTMVLPDDWKLIASSTTFVWVDCTQSQFAILRDDDDSGAFQIAVRNPECLQPGSLSQCPASESKTTKMDHDLNTKAHPPSQEEEDLDHPLAFGILSDVEDSQFFNVRYYGPSLVETMPSWPFMRPTFLIDTVPVWERFHGRFWIRSQIVHYLFEKWQHPELQHRQDQEQQKQNHHLYSLSPEHRPIVVFYLSALSKTNRRELKQKFGRNATHTQHWDRFMEMAYSIRQLYHPLLKEIYVVMDEYKEKDDRILPIVNIPTRWPDWDFYISSPWSSGNGQGATMMKGAQYRKLIHNKDMLQQNYDVGAVTEDLHHHVIADLEVMRRADFLVGSFQSNQFRLGAELNAAWFAGYYPAPMQRHWSLDVEWFEDP